LKAVEIAESYSDNRASGEDLFAARSDAWLAVEDYYISADDPARKTALNANGAAYCACGSPDDAAHGGLMTMEAAYWAEVHTSGAVPEAEYYARARPQYSALLRDIFGNPFRPVTTVVSWLTTIPLNEAQVTAI
jgi:hypothetical protein